MKNTNNLNSSQSEVKTKKKGGFNIIDFLIIIIVLAFVFVIINLVSPLSVFKKFFVDQTYTIRYTVEFVCVDEQYIDMIAENDTVVDSVSKHSLGRVDVVDNSTVYTTLEYNEANGSGSLSTHDGKYNVLVTITAEGSYSKGEGYSINGKRIAVGEKMSLRFPDYAAEGYCVTLSVNE
jgi:hypothetical protein